MGVERLAATESARLLMHEPKNMQVWLRSELTESKQELTAVKDQLKASGERITPMLCNGVLKTASKLIGRYNSA